MPLAVAWPNVAELPARRVQAAITVNRVILRIHPTFRKESGRSFSEELSERTVQPGDALRTHHFPRLATGR